MPPTDRISALRALVAVALLSPAPAALADDRECDGTIADERVDANAIVHDACTLDRTIVNGNVHVRTGARARIVRGGRVDGNVQLESDDAHTRAGGDEVDGDVQAFRNRGARRIAVNTIGANLQCKEDRSAPEGPSNRVEGNREDQCRRP